MIPRNHELFWVEVPADTIEEREVLYTQKLPPFNAPSYSNLRCVICFVPEVEEWIMRHVRRRSVVRLAYSSRVDSSNDFTSVGRFVVGFPTEKDAIFFKMRWF